MSTAIQWTDETWNPVTGCTRVSEGCRNCYIERTPAFRIAKRKFVNGTTGVMLHPDRLERPLKWKRPHHIFVNSLSDLFHDDVPDDFIDKVFAVMALTPRHTFQLLTKRPERMHAYLKDNGYRAEMVGAEAELMSGLDRFVGPDRQRWPFPLPNIWLGVSVEDQKTADERIPLLLKTPATVRWISLEPLLGPIDFEPGGYLWRLCQSTKEEHDREHDAGMWCDERGLDWVVVGGESGPGARPCDVAWVRSITEQCQEAGVPVFVKQLGANIAPLKVEAGSVRERLFLKDKKGGDMAEWPEDLRVRQWPAA